MNRTVIVTGASRGIGRAIARCFGKNGYNVLINYKNAKEKAMSLRRQLKSAEIFRADVSVREQVDEMTKFCIDRFGGIDVLVNNAGVAQFKLFTQITDEEWDSMIKVNLTGTFNCCQSVLRYMIKGKKGKIINISSIWGLTGASCEVHYSAAKAGVIGLTKALAKELAPSNIQVNCIAPGVIQTDMTGDLTGEEMLALKNDIPAGRIGVPEDISGCALFLADEKNSYITGQVISPNGGFVI